MPARATWTQHHDGLWTVEKDNALPGGLHFGVRMAVAKLPDGTLWLHSPIAIDAELAAQIDDLGAVSHIIAPNLFHNAWAGDAKKRYPNATLHGPAALRAKKKDIPLDAELGQPHDDWGDLFAVQGLRGAPMVDEFVFLHRPSKTLITTDMVFNIVAPKNVQTRVLMWMVGCSGSCQMSRSWKHFFARDKAALGDDIVNVLKWDFDRVTMCHGDVIETGGKAVVMEAARWIVPSKLLPA